MGKCDQIELACLRAKYAPDKYVVVFLDEVTFYRQLTVAQDWEEQVWRYPPKLPQSWQPVSATPGDPNGRPMVLLNLPTYASWLNPIEKLWRWLKQDLLHMHRLSSRSDNLKQKVDQFLDRFDARSIPLLRYVGSLPD